MTNTDSLQRIVAELRLIDLSDEVTGLFPYGNPRTLADRLERLSAAEQKVTEWQPIETAPKDGSRVLLGCAQHGSVIVGRWRHDAWSSPCGYDGEDHLCASDPTNWQPLPVAPPVALRAACESQKADVGGDGMKGFDEQTIDGVQVNRSKP